ncbi:MAG TPA: SelB C-terminal domain-containing protein, partial [Candidatus Acidoferrum sp.]|nr:SelB C-terminal domain-containing protein [Candidatus Acidoferrum sp.]
GTILDPIARRPRSKESSRQPLLSAIEKNEKPEILARLVDRSLFGLPQRDIPAYTGWTDSEIVQTVSALVSSNRLRAVPADSPLLYPATAFQDLLIQIAGRVERFHKENLLQPGISREELRAALARRLRPEIFRCALDELIAQKKLDAAGELVKRAGAQVSLLPEEIQAKDQIERAFASAGLAVPSVKEVLAALAIEPRRSEKLLQLLLRDKALLRITPELIFHREALAELRSKLVSYKKAKGERISVPAFKDLTGITRKYAIPLLEYLDRERVTRRQADERVIL